MSKTKFQEYREERENDIENLYNYYKTTQPLANNASILRAISDDKRMTTQTVRNVLKRKGVLS